MMVHGGSDGNSHDKAYMEMELNRRPEQVVRARPVPYVVSSIHHGVRIVQILYFNHTMEHAESGWRKVTMFKNNDTMA